MILLIALIFTMNATPGKLQHFPSMKYNNAIAILFVQLL